MRVAGEEEWAPITRVPIDSAHLNGYDGIRAKQVVGLFSREYKFNWYLCADKNLGDVLASTIVHEAMHACASVSVPGIFDYRFPHPPGCSAEELENVCASR